ncbi:MAG: ABC-ATPase domain-containing protein [Desulfobacteraceae bacterium]|jgi:predicted ABC-class ATPase
MAKEKTMPSPLQPMGDLLALFKRLDGQSFSSYRNLLNKAFCHHRYHLRFIHIQGSPGAFPASVCHLGLKIAELGLADGCLSNRPRRMATADYLLRALSAGVAAHARQNRGHQGSGSFQPLSLPPQVLERNVVSFESDTVQIAFRVSLPGSPENRVLGRQAAQMFSRELTGIVDTLKAWVAKTALIKRHCDVVEDMVALQNQLGRYGLVAFVGDGAILPRQSGVSQAPLKEEVVAFYAPDQMAVEVEFTNAGRKRGLGVRPGVNVLIGGGFHGKSTLLDALAKGVYPHIPGDGREQVVTHPDAAFICAEDGRAVNGLDISGFIDNLPGKVDAKRFWTKNASGSTSEAAAIIEAVLAGAKLLLIDEDSSATNFLIKDRNMRKLIPQDTITPLFDRVRELDQRFGVSTLIVVGGSSEYLGVAEHVIAMQDYLPVCMTERVRHLSLPAPERPARPLMLSDKRRLLADNFNPSYRARRLGKTLSVRIKPLRLQEKVLEYGNEQLDLTKLTALVDPYQVMAVGYALLLARNQFMDRLFSPSGLADAVYRLIEEEGLAMLSRSVNGPVFLARPRMLELAGAINRLRNLKVEIIETSSI